MSDGIPCLWMRGGSSKGAYFLSEDLPSNPAERDALLLRIMGGPDPLQIDGIGGGNPLSSKVAILQRSASADADVDYLFLQVFVDRPLVSSAQGCGNLLAGVGPAAIERGLVPAKKGITPVRIRMLNTGEVADARVRTPGGMVTYQGETEISGVPGRHAPVELLFRNIAGSTCGTLLPTGRSIDLIDGVECTLIDNGMPVVVMRASDLGISGYETPEALEANASLAARVEAIRLQAGGLMGLGDVLRSSVPKMALVSSPKQGAVLSVRCFIPHRVHASLGVFAAVSLATACLLEEGPAASMAELPVDHRFRLEHPTGEIEVVLDRAADGTVTGAGTTRTARKLFDGRVFPG